MIFKKIYLYISDHCLFKKYCKHFVVLWLSKRILRNFINGCPQYNRLNIEFCWILCWEIQQKKWQEPCFIHWCLSTQWLGVGLLTSWCVLNLNQSFSLISGPWFRTQSQILWIALAKLNLSEPEPWHMIGRERGTALSQFHLEFSFSFVLSAHHSSLLQYDDWHSTRNWYEDRLGLSRSTELFWILTFG